MTDLRKTLLDHDGLNHVVNRAGDAPEQPTAESVDESFNRIARDAKYDAVQLRGRERTNPSTLNNTGDLKFGSKPSERITTTDQDMHYIQPQLVPFYQREQRPSQTNLKQDSHEINEQLNDLLMNF